METGNCTGTTSVATDFVDGTVDDGSPSSSEFGIDLHARLAAYARDDVAIRLEIPSADVAITANVPTLFRNGCIGFEGPARQGCDAALTPGAIVLLGRAGESFTYHVADVGFVATNFTPGEITQAPDAAVVALQQELRMDVAERLAIPMESTSVVSFLEVTWRNGCLGVSGPGAVCTQALVDGFLAMVSDGRESYRYHGSGSQFIAASFEDSSITISDPLPRGQ